MQCHHGVIFAGQSQISGHIQSRRPCTMLQQGVDHDVAHKVDLSRIDTFRLRFSSASRLVVKRRSASESVTNRLISSGIVRSKLRRPASTCATGISSFAATSVQAIVELTSPDHDDHVRSLCFAYLFELHHDACRLNRMGGRADFQIDIRWGN